MNAKIKILFFLAICVALIIQSCDVLNQKKIDYATQVKPLLNKQCLACHGGVKKAGGFSLLFREEAIANTESGKPAIVPFFPEKSDFIKRLTHKDPEERMPYKHAPLQQNEIDLLTNWVKEGAAWSQHWAYVPPVLPAVKKGFFAWFADSWGKNDIDILVKNVLDQQKLKHLEEAEPEILLRRLTLDLTGLPPTAILFQQEPITKKAFEEFLKNNNAANYEKVVDQLLASQSYGERWASVWLDLARYSDSRGYQKDNGRNIWKYRDWVINSLNTDKPYNQFVTEQLAGDLLPNPQKEQLIATAFHRNTMNNDETGTVDEEFRVAAVIDRINTTFEVLQGTTMACVQCHSHPYDPFKHDEYYKLMAFFNNTRDEDTQDEAPFVREFQSKDQLKFDSLKTYLMAFERQKSVTVLNFVNHLEPRFHAHYADNYVKGTLLGDRNIGLFNGGSCRLPNLKMDGKTTFLCALNTRALGGKVEIRKDSPSGEIIGSISKMDTTAKYENVLKEIKIKSLVGRHDLYLLGINKSLEENKEVFAMNWFALMEDLPQNDVAKKQCLALIKAKTDNTPIMLASAADYQRPTKVFTRGNWLVHGKEVKATTPNSLNKFESNYPQNRLGLAKWMFNAQNPLTARVLANRIWEQLFGIGIVETLEDFGTQGAKPSNQPLLDYMAVKLMQDYKWQIKPLVKSIVLSATYKQESKVSADLLERDPLNKYQSRGPRMRLPAEAIRDQSLAICGLLNNKMYGKPVLPFQPDGVWQAVNSSLNYKQSEGEDNYRRAIYTFARRTGPYPSMLSFDAGSRELCLSRRIRTNTPLQSLTLLNDPVFVEISKSLAIRTIKQSSNQEEWIKNAYFLAMHKTITSAKEKALKKLFEKAQIDFEKQPQKSIELVGKTKIKNLAAMTIVCNTMINLDEFVVKE